MKKILFISALFAATLLSAMPVVKNGKSDYVIVIAPNAPQEAVRISIYVVK